MHLAGLAVPGCDFNKGCGWFGKWMASHLLGFKSPGIAAFSTTSLCFSPVSVEQCGPWGQAGAQGLTQPWQGISGGLMGSAGKSKFARTSLCAEENRPSFGPMAIKQNPREEGTRGVRDCSGWCCGPVQSALAGVTRSGAQSSPAAAERHRPLCAAGLSRRQKVEREMNQLIMIITVLCLS